MTDIDQLINLLRADLTAAIDPHTRDTAQRFFKEPIKVYGIKSATVSRLSRQYWPQIKNLTKPELFNLAEKLFKSGYCEEAYLAADWLAHYGHCQLTDIEVYEKWLSKYIDNWAKCDTLCNHSLGNLLTEFPELIPRLKIWAKSPNQWLRRAAAVSLILPARKGKFLKEALEIADLLFADSADLVQKGYGWLLKEASREHQAEIFDYVFQHRATMPRTALRYAIEKMPADLKKRAMAKN